MVAINEVIGEMLTAAAKVKPTGMPLSIRTDLAAELPKTMVDRVQLQQVFMNLMLNGIEAMKESGGELTVEIADSRTLKC